VPFSQVRDDVALFYTDEGEGDLPLLLVHGWGCDSSDWGWQLEYFAQRTRVITVDLRGHGASTVTEEGYDPRTLAADIALLLADLGVAEVVAAGHSLGGLIVSALAIEHDNLVRSVIAIEPSYGYRDEDAGPFVELAEQLTVDNARDVASSLAGRADGDHTPAFFTALHRRRFQALAPHVIVQAFAENWLGPRQFGRRAEAEAYLSARTCPSLTVYSAGHDDAAAWATARAREGVDEVTYIPLGHWPHQEVPTLFNALIESWVQRLA
jgi:pimeloyl-ACP methyl ester carboxylesterase